MAWKWFATMKKLIKLVGFNFEKNGPCSLENDAKISKKKYKMAKNHFSRADLCSKFVHHEKAGVLTIPIMCDLSGFGVSDRELWLLKDNRV